MCLHRVTVILSSSEYGTSKQLVILAAQLFKDDRARDVYQKQELFNLLLLRDVSSSMALACNSVIE